MYNRVWHFNVLCMYMVHLFYAYIIHHTYYIYWLIYSYSQTSLIQAEWDPRVSVNRNICNLEIQHALYTSTAAITFMKY